MPGGEGGRDEEEGDCEILFYFIFGFSSGRRFPSDKERNMRRKHPGRITFCASIFLSESSAIRGPRKGEALRRSSPEQGSRRKTKRNEVI